MASEDNKDTKKKVCVALVIIITIAYGLEMSDKSDRALRLVQEGSP